MIIIKKFKLENGNKIKIFERKDIINKLGRSEEEWKLINKYQKKFPMLTIVESEDKHPIDGEELCIAIEVKGKYVDWLLAERGGNKGKLIKYGFIEGKDFFVISRKTSKGRPKKEIKLSTACAKKVAMKQNNAVGDLVADYFILMELVIKDYDQWVMVRNPEKEGYNQLMEAVKSNYMLTHYGKEPHFSVYSNEGDMINICLLGARAKEIRTLLEVKDNQTWDNLTTQINKAIYELQIMDIGLLMGQLNFNDRKETLLKMCKSKYSQIYLQSNKLLSEAV